MQVQFPPRSTHYTGNESNRSRALGHSANCEKRVHIGDNLITRAAPLPPPPPPPHQCFQQTKKEKCLDMEEPRPRSSYTLGVVNFSPSAQIEHRHACCCDSRCRHSPILLLIFVDPKIA